VHGLVITVSVVNSAILVVLAVLATRRWRNRRDPAAGWLALAFVAIALIVTVGRLVPVHPHGLAEDAAQRFDIEMLVLFPYFLYRFATAFAPPTRRLQTAVAALTVGLTIWTFAMPRFPGPHDAKTALYIAYIVAFFIHWALLSVVVTTRLWRAGRNEPAVAANRMRMLGFAAAALTVALIGTVFASNQSSPAALAVQVIALVAVVAFLLGIEPPQIIRTYWRNAAQQQFQTAVRDLVTLAMTRQEIATRVAPPSAALVGARGIQISDGAGELLASFGATDGSARRIEQPGIMIEVWTSPYAPFFGDDELRVLETIGVLTATALDRVRLFEQEHDARLTLERANELMTNFVALAAHELRTPVTTIHGFVQTLNHLGHRLSPEQTAELRTALEQQTRRMASLVEQLLDLSRLDADAVAVRPQRLDLRQRLEEVVAVAAGARLAEVELEIHDGSSVMVDPDILDHIVSNLVTNALRYGRAPVRVTATAVNGSVRVAVEDSGPGVAREIEDTLFERFTRAGVARDRVAGTGLGLAIAQAYARAHRGDLRYERGQPDGARFVVELPSV
jgi:signal transduction histidine kinase